MREKCQSPICSRKCIKPYINGVQHVCTRDELNCAQCGGNHFSLDSNCQIVKYYKEELKRAVDKALDSGIIKRPVPDELSRPFQVQNADFPQLNQAQVNDLHTNVITDKSTNSTNLKQEIEVLVLAIKSLSNTIIRTEKNFEELNNRIEIQDKRTKCISNSMYVLVDAIHLIFTWIQSSSNEKSKLRNKINKSIENLHLLKQNLNISTTNSSSATSKPTTVNNSIFTNNINGGSESKEDLSSNLMEKNE